VVEALTLSSFCVLLDEEICLEIVDTRCEAFELDIGEDDDSNANVVLALSNRYIERVIADMGFYLGKSR